jgi:hypothetical protein
VEWKGKEAGMGSLGKYARLRGYAVNTIELVAQGERMSQVEVNQDSSDSREKKVRGRDCNDDFVTLQVW